MPADANLSPRVLSRENRKRLLVLACACDRPEWQIQVRQSTRGAKSPVWWEQAVRLGWKWLPAWDLLRRARGSRGSRLLRLGLQAAIRQFF